jgi:capsular polysaccharide biosynthesis protein
MMTFSSIQNNGSGTFVHKTGRLDDAWTDDEFTADADPAVDRATAFASLAFIAAALKRSAWLCCAVAFFALIIGYGMYVKFPPAYQATTSVLLTNNPNADSTAQSQNNVILAQSQAVAQRVLRQLGLNQSVRSFLAAYTVTAPSDQVLVFTVGAPSSGAAVQRAGALATAFLQFRDEYLQNQQQLQVTLANQQVTAAEQKVNSINRQISALTAQGATSGQSGKLSALQAQLTSAQDVLGSAQQNETAVTDTTSPVLASMIRGSQILNAPTAIPRSLKTGKLFYLVVAFIAGLAIGAAIVIIRALVSDRLRNRDDIASAIGAPVMLSTGQVGTNWLPRLGRRGRKQARDVRRFEGHLNGAIVPAGAKRFATLAIVAVDNARDVAPTVVSLALNWAGQGRKVVLADLSGDASAARKLGVKRPGVHTISVRGTGLVVTLPGPDEIPPVGPLPTAPSRTQFGHVDPDLAAACASADLVLTLVVLDPVFGGDHLATWATEAVAVVTAGRSSSTRICAVGEMIRLAGTHLTSVVLLEADKSDESLGVRLASEGQSAPSLPF